MEQCALTELQEDEEVSFQDNTLIDVYAVLIFQSECAKTFMADPTIG
jgi:hypothetical protein